MTGGGGGTTVVPPSISPEEQALLREQLDLLRLQRDQLTEQLRVQDLLAPQLFESLGIRPIYSGGETVTTPGTPGTTGPTAEQTAQINALQTRRDQLQSRVDEAERADDQRAFAQELAGVDAELNALRAAATGTAPTGPTTSVTPRTLTGFEDIPETAEERRLRELNERFQERTLAELDLDAELAPLRAQIEQAHLQRSQAALSGTLPVDPALERSLQEEERRLRDQLAANLGPGFETSTPGIEALANFRRRAEELRYAARRDQLTTSEGLSAAREAATLNREGGFLPITDLTDRFRTSQFGSTVGLPGALYGAGAGFGALAGGFNGPLSVYGNNRNQAFQAAVQNANSSAASSASLFSGLGNLAGMALFAPLGPGGAAASSIAGSLFGNLFGR